MLKRLRRWLWVALCIQTGLSVPVAALAWFSTDHLRAFGGNPSESTRARMRASPRFIDDHFENGEPTRLMLEGSTWQGMVRWLGGEEQRAPTCPLPVVADTAKRLALPSQSGLRVTWLGHSTTLIEIDGVAILTDPMWSERASPSSWIGPRRFHAPPLALADLPRLAGVIISHEHYDHLDMATVRQLAARGVPFHVPLGIGGHLAAWGVPEAQILEHDWWQSMSLAEGVQIISTPARHFNGRGLPWRTGALWTSWAMIGPRHRVFYSGDTGLTESFREIAARAGPFDVALLEIGQYDRSWGEIHLGPVGALQAQAMLGAKVLLPVHWATFELGFHAWSEPAETLLHEAQSRGALIATPRLGEPVEPTEPLHTTPWWRALPPIAQNCP